MKLSKHVRDGFATITANYDTTDKNSNGRSAKEHNEDREYIIIIGEALEYCEQNNASDFVLEELIRRQAELIIALLAGRVLVPRKVRNALRKKNL